MDLRREKAEPQGRDPYHRALTTSDNGRRWTDSQTLAQMLYQDQDALQSPNTCSLPQHPHAATTNLLPWHPQTHAQASSTQSRPRAQAHPSCAERRPSPWPG